MNHPTQLELDRFSVGDLPAGAAKAASTHVEQCPMCRHYLAELAGEKSALLDRLPAAAVADRLMAAVQPPTYRAFAPTARKMTWIAGALAAAAMALLWLRPAQRGETTFKGGAALSLLRQRGAETQVLGTTGKVAPGDALAVRIALAQSMPVMVWTYEEGSTETAAALERITSEPIGSMGPGEVTLPMSLRVEAPCRPFWILVATGRAASAATEERLRQSVSRLGRLSVEDLPQGLLLQRVACE